MKKDITRDYVTAMFRAYSAYGCKNAEEVGEIIFKSEIRKGSSERAARRAVRRSAALLADIEAVDTVLAFFNASGRHEISAAVESVYFTQPQRGFRRGDISARVRRHAYESHYSEKQIYTFLAEARQRAAFVRGLRVGDM